MSKNYIRTAQNYWNQSTTIQCRKEREKRKMKYKKNILETKVNSRILIKEMNTRAVSIVRYA